VEQPKEAAAVIERELAAAGRAVARAVRLRIALAPGVKLVSVLGSHPLDAHEVAAVRQRERAIDLDVAEMSGIRADRGADEDGIQIVIPAFMAGDDHAILLDVVVPGPGPVLDVRARFKDLVRMRNGEAQASLELARGEATPTPLTLAVVERRAAFDVGEALREAAGRLPEGDAAGASERMRRASAMLEQVARANPGARLEADRRLLEAYLGLLSAEGWASEPGLTRFVKDSMSLSAALRSGAR
jgi:hypothetical protein